MSKNINILVTGAESQLGKSLQAIQKEFPTLNFIFCSRRELDITRKDSIIKMLSNHRFSYCINAAAYTQVDRAEEEIDLCMEVNALALQDLAGELKNKNISLIHISSDYVYHNDLRRPLKETDPIMPKGVYARSKLLGEQLALESNPQTVIFRTSWLYSPYNSNFIKTLLTLFSTQNEIKVVNDQIGQLTYAMDLARTIADYVLYSISNSNESNYGVYNFSNSGEVSWYDVAEKVKSITRANCKIIPISSAEYGSIVNRPSYSVLDLSKIEKHLHVKGLPWSDRLEACLKRIDTY